MDTKEPEKNEEVREQPIEGEQDEGIAKESVITVEQIEKAKKVSRNVFNDAIALLFDADNRLKPLCKTKDLTFTFIIAALFVLLSTILGKGPLGNVRGLAVFIGTIVQYFAGALSVYITIKFLAGKDATYREGLNIMSVMFIPLIVSVVLSFLFSFASMFLAGYIQIFGMTVAILLLYNAIKVTYELTIRSSIYLLPVIFTLLFIFLRIIFNLLGLA